MKKSNIMKLNFNQDQGLFSCCMTSGLRIYNSNPLVEMEYYSPTHIGTVAHCELLNRTNYFALVPGGPRPKYRRNSVLIFDDMDKRVIGELPFNSEIKQVKLRNDKLIIVLERRIYICRFENDIEVISSINTRMNTRGVCDVTPHSGAERQILIFPGHKLGSVEILDLTSLDTDFTTAPVTINAHQNELAYVALSPDGNLAATASVKGTLIRVWNTVTKDLIMELRRGVDDAVVYNICFSRDSGYLCCSSDKGTVHVFALKEVYKNKKFPRDKLSNPMGVTQHRAYITFAVPDDCVNLCGFQAEDSVMTICYDGSFHKHSINVLNTEGNSKREQYDVFLNVSDDAEYLN